MYSGIMIAGTGSGSGKTTICMAILAALKKRGLDIAAFKCGPDYIDPMYHRKVLGIPSHNLDPFFCDEAGLKRVYSDAMERTKAKLAVIEGVMGYYDGIGIEGKASCYDVSRACGLPVILVINGRGMVSSAGAIIRGFKTYKEQNNICGVIFNNVSENAYRILENVAASENVTCLGYLPNNKEYEIGSRHLGLLTADEALDIDNKTERLADDAEKYLKLDELISLIETETLTDTEGDSPLPTYKTGSICGRKDTLAGNMRSDETERKLRLAVARDEAFSFIYEENLEMLESLGCEPEYFSPIKDREIPQNADGLYIPGGYPEIHADELEANESMRESIRDAVESGLPTIAECGGFMYLHDDIEGKKMAGIIKGSVHSRKRPVRFGYGTMSSEKDTLLLAAGESMRVHEFHYYDSDDPGSDYISVKAGNGNVSRCAYATDTLYAGFPHIYLPGAPEAAKRFVEAMRRKK